MTKQTKIIQMDDNDEYKVGYGKPPKTTRFKKGQSGNPNGRKPRVAYEEDDFPIRRFMMELMEVKLKGKKEKMTRFDVLLMTLIQKALSGCFKSLKLLIQESGGLKAFREEWKRQKNQADQEMIDQVWRDAEHWQRKL